MMQPEICNNLNWFPVGWGGQVLVSSPSHPTNLDTKSPGKARLEYYWRIHVLGTGHLLIAGGGGTFLRNKYFNNDPPYIVI